MVAGRRCAVRDSYVCRRETASSRSSPLRPITPITVWPITTRHPSCNRRSSTCIHLTSRRHEAWPTGELERRRLPRTYVVERRDLAHVCANLPTSIATVHQTQGVVTEATLGGTVSGERCITSAFAGVLTAGCVRPTIDTPLGLHTRSRPPPRKDAKDRPGLESISQLDPYRTTQHHKPSLTAAIEGSTIVIQ